MEAAPIVCKLACTRMEFVERRGSGFKKIFDNRQLIAAAKDPKAEVAPPAMTPVATPVAKPSETLIDEVERKVLSVLCRGGLDGGLNASRGGLNGGINEMLIKAIQEHPSLARKSSSTARRATG